MLEYLYVAEKHDAAREACLMWMKLGEPANRLHFDKRKRRRALFKLALRNCKNDIEELKADACAENLLDKDSGIVKLVTN